MWVFGTKGFLSIVKDKNDPGRFCVRARTRDHLDNYALVGIPGVKVYGPDDMPVYPDYPWRVFVPVEHVIDLMANEMRSIDYPDFKTAVKLKAETKAAYTQALGAVWSIAHQFEEREYQPESEPV